MEEKNKRNGIEHIKALFDQLLQDYEDVYLKSLDAKVFGYVTGNHLQEFLPNDKNAIILDAGGGLHKLDRYVDEGNAKPVYLFLSHFHLDHIIGLHTLTKFNFRQGLNICIPTGTRDILEMFVNAPFTAAISQLPFPVNTYELPEEADKLPFTTEARELRHPSLTLGYRFEIEGKVISYCPDTGLCDNAIHLARSSDLLIAECAYKSGQSSENWPHLNPETAATIARDAAVDLKVISYQ